MSKIIRQADSFAGERTTLWHERANKVLFGRRGFKWVRPEKNVPDVACDPQLGDWPAQRVEGISVVPYGYGRVLPAEDS